MIKASHNVIEQRDDGTVTLTKLNKPPRLELVNPSFDEGRAVCDEWFLPAYQCSDCKFPFMVKDEAPKFCPFCGNRFDEKSVEENFQVL
jgi:rubrerythrin